MTTLRSFDVWDTLLRRRCHPDEVKLATAAHVYLRFFDRLRDPGVGVWGLFQARVSAEWQIAEWRKSQGHDPEYEIHEVLEKWLLESLRLTHPARVAPALATELAEFEVGHEIRVSYLDARGASLVRRANGGPVVALSDFYMGERQLRRVLEAAAPDLRFDHVVVSGEARLNKRSGRLYKHLHERLGAAASAHVHVGNSPDADVRPARSLGIAADLFTHPPEDELARAHHDRFRLRGPGLDPGLADLHAEVERRCPVPAGLGRDARALYRIGLRFAPVVCGLVLKSVEEAITRRVPVVHYFTREGEYFKAIHETMAPHTHAGLPFPRAELLEVSRLSTFFPSLRAITPQELMRVWNLYTSQSVEQLLRTFGVSSFAAEPLIRRRGLDPRERIRCPWKDPRVRALLADPLFRRLLWRWRDERRRDTIDYLASRALNADTERAVVVDIGWRGTIQDNLAHLLPRTHFAGVYLGLLPLLNEQPANTSKAAFGPDAQRDDASAQDAIRFVAPIEMICNTGRGSVRGYMRRPDGSVAAVRRDHPGENAVHERYTRHLQAGVLAAAPVFAEWCRRHAVTSGDLRAAALDLLRVVTRTPPRVLARAFFTLDHDETFGEGGLATKRGVLPGWAVRRARRSDKGWTDLVRIAENTTWPQGCFALNRRRRELDRYNRERIPAPASAPAIGMIEAKRQLMDLESSRAWRLVNALKRNPVYGLYARRRFGPGWDRGPDFETAEDRLARLRSTRTYELVVRMKSNRLVRLATRPLRRQS